MGTILTLLHVVFTPWARVPFPIFRANPPQAEIKPHITNKQCHEKGEDGMAREVDTKEYRQTDKLGWSTYLEAARKSELYGPEL